MDAAGQARIVYSMRGNKIEWKCLPLMLWSMWKDKRRGCFTLLIVRPTKCISSKNGGLKLCLPRTTVEPHSITSALHESVCNNLLKCIKIVDAIKWRSVKAHAARCMLLPAKSGTVKPAKTHRPARRVHDTSHLCLSFLNTAISFIHTLHSVRYYKYNTWSVIYDRDLARFAFCRRSRFWSQQAYRRLSFVDKINICRLLALRIPIGLGIGHYPEPFRIGGAPWIHTRELSF